MWLLDHNVPVQLRGLLVEYGVEAETVVARGWQALRNGDLVATANRDGFRVLLTRDSGFAEAARSVLIPSRSVTAPLRDLEDLDCSTALVL